MKKLTIFIAFAIVALTAQSALAQGEKELVIKTAHVACRGATR
jgi:hypothetical protein